MNDEFPINDEIDARSEAKKMFHLKLESADDMLALLSGVNRTQKIEGESERITSTIDPSVFGGSVKTSSSHESNSQITHEDISFSENTDIPVEIMEALNCVEYSDSDAHRQKQIKHIANAIRSASDDFTVKEVASNTKKAFKDHAKKFTKISGGIEVEYEFNGMTIVATVLGKMSGREVVAVKKMDRGIRGTVLDADTGEDISSGFSVSVIIER